MTPKDIKHARIEHNLSQRSLAERLGTTVTTVSRLENDATPIDARWRSHLYLLFAKLERDAQPATE